MALSRSILAALSAAVLVPAATAAQLCRNAPPLAGNSFGNVSAGASLFDSGNTISAGVSVGSTVFASAGGSYTRYDTGGRHMNGVGGSLGYEITSLGPDFSLCPTASTSYGWGFEDQGLSVTTLSFSPAVAAGYRIVLEPTVDVVPAAELALVHDRITAETTTTEKFEDTYGLLSMSLGFQIRRRWAIVPVVQIPLADEGLSSTFGLSLVIALGGNS